MSQVKKIGMVAGTFSVALGIGFVMQNGDALASRFGASEEDRPAPFTVSDDSAVQVVQASLSTDSPEPSDFAPDAEAIVAMEEPVLPTPEPSVELAVVLPEAVRIEETPASPVQMASIDPEALPEVGTEIEASTEIDCIPNLIAVAGAAATINLAVSAPCHSNTPFKIHHQGMMFTAMTNEDGTAKLVMPALAEVAVLIAAFESNDGAVATVTVPDFSNYDRAVLQWQGETAVMLSAYEGDAVFGDPSHIHAANPGDIERLVNAEGGHLMRLGDSSVADALMAEVYTFPSGMVVDPLDVMLVAEAEITANNCGQELSAQSIQIGPSGNATALDLQMIMPDCDAIGDFLILQNMFEDLTLASR